MKWFCTSCQRRKSAAHPRPCKACCGFRAEGVAA